MEPGGNEATPLVYNGVMYLGNPGDVIQAIDAVTGDLLWEYRHPLPPVASFHNGLGQRKRSIALYGDEVYFVTWDNFVVSLAARTGELVWKTDRGGNLYTSNSTGPICGQRCGDRRQHVPVFRQWLLRHRARRQDRPGAVAERNDSPAGPTR
jgi:alcohol dehydrogenase (cytochrome c)